ncbi:efflux RND transporter permease subunit [Aquidulcibacter paucihalophilus]|uniref:efflux RND transporter permease subunit n=1 Tax=Aquidulcibacter paucihalophilus TaxID=1978549 RepID=UPI000A191FCD|nr:efflux RND transporter permease subunit [Aquidulcibacter paucihalophilus]
MFDFLVATSLRNRVLVLFASLALILFGILATMRLPVDVLPDLNKPTVTIMTEAGGMAPPEVEAQITQPLENAMSGIPGVSRVRSVTGVGLSMVYVEFGWDAEIFRARQQVSERLALAKETMADLDHTPQMGPVTSIMGEILLVAIPYGDADPMAAREVADFQIRPRLLTIPGVAQVIPIGGQVRQFRISPNAARMGQLFVSLEAIERAAQGFASNTGGGFIDQGGREFVVRALSRTARVEDLGSISVTTRTGGIVRLDQVADVEFAARFRRGDAGFAGKPAVIIGIQKQPGADTVAVTKSVEAALTELNKTLPKGVTATQVQMRQADFIEASLGTLQKVIIEAGLVVAVILFLFLLNVRTTAISLAALPMSILITALVFSAFGLSINTMTLGGLAIAVGELVDDAVVGVENVYRRLKENRALPAPLPAVTVIARATGEVRSGIVYATMIIILVFLPLFFLSGIEGRLFQPLGMAYVVSILASLLVSITLTPVLCYYLLPTMKTLPVEHDSWLVVRLKRANQSLLEWGFQQVRPVLIGATLAGFVAIGGALMLPRAFLPAFNESTLLVGLTLQPGVSLADSARMGAAAERLISAIPGVESVSRRTGRAELDEHAEGVHSNELDVRLDPNLSSKGRDQVAADIRRALGPIPASVGIGGPLAHRIDHMLSGVASPVAVKIYGEDMEAARRSADALQARMVGIEGLVDARVEKIVRVPQLEVIVDYQRAALYGANPAEVTRSVEALSGGQTVSRIIDGVRRFDVVIRLPEGARTTQALSELLIETPSGIIPLSQIATVRETDGPNQINRENGKRRIVVQANLAPGANLSAITKEIRAAMEAVPAPTGGFYALEGQFEAQAEATATIGGLTLVSFTLIFALLYSRYRSVALAMIVMGGVPMAMIGSVIALWLFGLPLSVASLIGFIALTGIAARNGILKISHYLNLVVYEGETFGDAMIIRGTLERLTPVLMTALSAGLALIPLIIGAGEPGKEILHPVAVTIFGGLISATLLDALVTPILFKLFGQKPLEQLVLAQKDGQLKETF